MKFRAEVKRIVLANALAMTGPMVIHATAMEYSRTDAVLRSGPNVGLRAVGMLETHTAVRNLWGREDRETDRVATRS